MMIQNSSNGARSKHSIQASDNVEKLNRALPPLIKPNNLSHMPSESAATYYARVEPYRRLCEARAVLRWLAGGEFNVTDYFSGLSKKRGKDSAIMLKYDVMELFDTVIKHDPSLYDLLNPQLKLLKDHYRLALSELVSD